MPLGGEIRCIHLQKPELCARCKDVNPLPSNRRAWVAAANHPVLPRRGPVKTGIPHGPRTSARFDSNCPSCNEPIEEGVDMVFMRDDEWLCEGCAEDYDQGGS